MTIGRLAALAALASLLITSIPVMAAQPSPQDPGAYIGLDLGGAQISLSDADTDYDLLGFGVGIGYRVLPYLALEARMGRYFSSEEWIDDLPVEVGVSSYVSALGKIILPLPGFDLYGIGGWTRTRLSVKVFDESSTTNKSDLTYGAGVAVYGAGQTGMRLEWQRLLDKDGVTVDALNIGVQYHF
jgi:hypothetical protein